MSSPLSHPEQWGSLVIFVRKRALSVSLFYRSNPKRFAPKQIIKLMLNFDPVCLTDDAGLQYTARKPLDVEPDESFVLQIVSR